jgi:superfamily I DNA/RNA helicase
MNEAWWVRQSQLDDDQKKVFTLPINEDHLIKGPPGSGKTNLLLLRAKQLIGSNFPNVIVVVHTRTLQEFLRSGAPKYGVPGDKILTFRKLGTDLLYRYGASITLPSDFERSRKILAEALEAQIKAKRLTREYSYVFADEAQDFLPEEIAALRRIGEKFFGVADSRQKIYKGQDSVEKLRSEMNNVELKFHYRNGKRICAVADALAKYPTGEPTLLETSKYDEQKAPSSVEIFSRTSLDAQCSDLLVQLDTQVKAYPGELIGVACARGEDLTEVIARLRSSPFAGQIVAQTSQDGYVPFQPGKDICASRLHSAKGLEFRAFNILAAEGLKKFPMQRELTFMGVTRAKTSLCIYHGDNLPGYLENAISTLKPKGEVLGLNDLLDDDGGEEEV